jgi:hypothetical protein
LISSRADALLPGSSGAKYAKIPYERRAPPAALPYVPNDSLAGVGCLSDRSAVTSFSGGRNTRCVLSTSALAPTRPQRNLRAGARATRAHMDGII